MVLEKLQMSPKIKSKRMNIFFFGGGGVKRESFLQVEIENLDGKAKKINHAL